MDPMTAFAESVINLFCKVDDDGCAIVHHNTPPVPGTRLVIQREDFQKDPTTVYVRFKSGHMAIFHRYTASDLEGMA